MLQRMLALGDGTIGRHDLGALRVIATSGSALPGELATRVMDAFGDVLYNLYGSTEVAWATIATPRTCAPRPARPAARRAAPSCALLGADGREVAPGQTGASSSATSWSSTATPAAAASRRSTG